MEEWNNTNEILSWNIKIINGILILMVSIIKNY